MLVLSLDPPVAYVFEDEFIVRIAVEKWDAELSASKKESHITNIQFTRTVSNRAQDSVYTLDDMLSYFKYVTLIRDARVCIRLLLTRPNAGKLVPRECGTTSRSRACARRSNRWCRCCRYSKVCRSSLQYIYMAVYGTANRKRATFLERSAARSLVLTAGPGYDAGSHRQAVAIGGEYDAEHGTVGRAIRVQKGNDQAGSLRYVKLRTRPACVSGGSLTRANRLNSCIGKRGKVLAQRQRRAGLPAATEAGFVREMWIKLTLVYKLAACSRQKEGHLW